MNLVVIVAFESNAMSNYGRQMNTNGFCKKALPQDNIKVGKTTKHPHSRAESLSKTIRGEYIVQWHMEVPDCDAAEKLAHIHLKKYHDEKEYFNIDVAKAVSIIQKAVCDVFEIDSPVIYKGEILRKINQEINSKNDLVKPSFNQKKEEQAVNKTPIELVPDSTNDDLLKNMTPKERLDLFVDDVYEECRAFL